MLDENGEWVNFDPSNGKIYKQIEMHEYKELMEIKDKFGRMMDALQTKKDAK